jgi:hypothetical protein
MLVNIQSSFSLLFFFLGNLVAALESYFDDSAFFCKLLARLAIIEIVCEFSAERADSTL